MARYPGRLELRAMGRDAPVEPDERDPVDVKWAEDGLALGRRSLHKGGWDLVLLGGVTRAVALGLLDLDRVLELVDERPAETTLVLTGPRPSEELCAAVDSVEDFFESSTT
jgi:ATP:corrinoid adenosyltransferase